MFKVEKHGRDACACKTAIYQNRNSNDASPWSGRGGTPISKSLPVVSVKYILGKDRDDYDCAYGAIFT